MFRFDLLSDDTALLGESATVLRSSTVPASPGKLEIGRLVPIQLNDKGVSRAQLLVRIASQPANGPWLLTVERLGTNSSCLQQLGQAPQLLHRHQPMPLSPDAVLWLRHDPASGRCAHALRLVHLEVTDLDEHTECFTGGSLSASNGAGASSSRASVSSCPATAPVINLGSDDDDDDASNGGGAPSRPSCGADGASSTGERHDEGLESLGALLEPGLPTSVLRALLSGSGGDVSRAANSYFDDPARAAATAVPSWPIGGGLRPATGRAAGASAGTPRVRPKGAASSSSRAAATLGDKKRKRQPAAAEGSRGGQLSIATFLGGSPVLGRTAAAGADTAVSLAQCPHDLTSEEHAHDLDADSAPQPVLPSGSREPRQQGRRTEQQASSPQPALQPGPALASPRADAPAPPPPPARPPPEPAPAIVRLRAGGSDINLPLSKYRPLDACWQPQIGLAAREGGASVPYLHLARSLDALEATRSRLDKERILTNAFRTVLAMGTGQAEVEATAYLFAPAKDTQSGGHRLRPEWSAGARPLGLSRASLTGAICEAVGGTPSRLSQINHSLRDTGAAAVELRDGGGGATRQQRLGFARSPPPLTAGHVRQKLLSLADISGEGAEARKTAVLAGLLRAAPPGADGASELKWLVRTCVPHMSAGISLAGSVLPALAAAVAIEVHAAAAADADAASGALEADAAAICASARAGEVAAPGIVAVPPAAHVRPLPPATELKAAQDAVRALYAVRPDVAEVVRVLHESRGDWRAVRRECTLRAGVPCSPMLAKPATTVRDALARCAPPLTAEYKYDGQRAQVHCDASGAVSIFSRRLEPMTEKYPEVVAAVRRAFLAVGAPGTDGRPGPGGEAGAPGCFILDTEIVPVKAAAALGAVSVFAAAGGAVCRPGADRGAKPGSGGIGIATSRSSDGGPSFSLAGEASRGQAAGVPGDAAAPPGGPALAAFQSLATRKRRDVTEANASLLSTPVKIVLFDLMFLGGASLLALPLNERRRRMRLAFQPQQGVLEFAQGVDILEAHLDQVRPGDASAAGQSSADASVACASSAKGSAADAHAAVAASAPLAFRTGASSAAAQAAGTAAVESVIDQALRAAVAAGCEGLMLKSLASTYEPSSVTRSDR